MTTLQDILAQLTSPSSQSMSIQDLITYMNNAHSIFVSLQLKAYTEIAEMDEAIIDIRRAKDRLQACESISNYLRRYIQLVNTLGSAQAHIQVQRDMISSFSNRMQGLVTVGLLPNACKDIHSRELAITQYREILEEIQSLKNALGDSSISGCESKIAELRDLYSYEHNTIYQIYRRFAENLDKLTAYDDVQSFERNSDMSTLNDMSPQQFIDVHHHYVLASQHRYDFFDSKLHLIHVTVYFAQRHPNQISLLYGILQHLRTIKFREYSLSYIHQVQTLIYTIKTNLIQNGPRIIKDRHGTPIELTLELMQAYEQAFDNHAATLKQDNPFLLLDSSNTASHKAFSVELYNLQVTIEQTVATCPDEFKSAFQNIAYYLRFYPNAFPHQKSLYLIEVKRILNDVVDLQKRIINAELKSYLSSFNQLILLELDKESFMLFDTIRCKQIISELKKGTISNTLMVWLRKEKLMPKRFVQAFQMDDVVQKVEPVNTADKPLSEAVMSLTSTEFSDDDSDWILVKYGRVKMSKQSKKNPSPPMSKNNSSSTFFGNDYTRKSSSSLIENTKAIEPFLSLSTTNMDSSSSIATTSSQDNLILPDASSFQPDLQPKLIVELPLIIQAGFQRIDQHMSFVIGSSVLDLIHAVEHPPVNLQKGQDIDFVSCKHPRHHFGTLLNYPTMPGILYVDRDNKDYLLECFVPHGIEETHFFVHDLETRDFTICTLYCNPKGEIFDPTGFGLTDYKNKTLRLHKAAQAASYSEAVQISIRSLMDDPVRILRLMKYLEKGYTLSTELIEALQGFTLEQSQMHKPRLYASARKLLQTYSPDSIVEKLNQYGLLTKLFDIETNVENDFGQLFCKSR